MPWRSGGSPVTDDRIEIRVRLPRRLVEDLDGAADRLVVSRSRLIQRCVEWAMAPEPEQPTSITCPKCGRTSHHPEDVRWGYCGACHWWTSDPLLAPLQPAELT